MSENHLDVVQQVKATLEAAGVSLSGACGAFRILNGVANRLNAGQALDDHQRPPWGLLLKMGGNRAVPQGGGGCLSGDESRDPGYATDYLIERGTWFGFDILGDGGGANNPQWPDEPETAPDMVERNRQNFRPPVPDGSASPPPPPPPSLPPPPPGELAALAAKVTKLDADLSEARSEIAVLEAKVHVLEQGKPGDTGGLVKRIEALEARKVPTGCEVEIQAFGRHVKVPGVLTY